MRRRWNIGWGSMSHKWVTNESRMSHEWVTNELRMRFATHTRWDIGWVTNESRIHLMGHEWVTNESRMSGMSHEWVTDERRFERVTNETRINQMSREWATNESRMSHEWVEKVTVEIWDEVRMSHGWVTDGYVWVEGFHRHNTYNHTHTQHTQVGVCRCGGGHIGRHANSFVALVLQCVLQCASASAWCLRVAACVCCGVHVLQCVCVYSISEDTQTLSISLSLTITTHTSTLKWVMHESRMSREWVEEVTNESRVRYGMRFEWVTDESQMSY